MKYPSKIDLWLVVVLLAAVVTPIVWSFTYFLTEPQGQSGLAFLITLIILAVTCISMYFTMWPCEYTLHDNHLNIRCGLIRQDITYRTIKSATKSGNMLSAPALSLKRIRIDHEKGGTLISPVNREQFISLLMEKVAQSKTLQGTMA